METFDKYGQQLLLQARSLREHVEKQLRVLNQLRAEVAEHNRLYYEEAAPVVPDKVFDDMLATLQQKEEALPQLLTDLETKVGELRQQNKESTHDAYLVREKELQRLFLEAKSYERLKKPTTQVGGAPTRHFPTIQHKYPMLSLSNTYSIEEFRKFDDRLRHQLGEERIAYVCEQKIDGIAISLVYENGQLSQGITRGDGRAGDLVTENICTLRSLPKQVQNCPPYFEVRGEVFLSKKAFDKLNEARVEADEPLYANPRNTASGTLKLQNSQEVAARRLSVYCYGLLCEDIPSDTQAGCLAQLKSWGFPVSPHYASCADAREVEKYIEEWQKKRKALPVETDGVVIKVDSRRYQNALGTTAKSPRWAIAYKYTPTAVSTRLLDVKFQVGRTGAITPVAELAAVQLQGTTVRRASLHNQAEIQRLSLHIDDLVYVEKGGDIIPKVLGIDPRARPKNSQPVRFPKHCPACGTKLEQQLEEADTYCPSTKACVPQILGSILHFISRNAVRIEALGKENIRALLQAGLIKDAADLYSLQPEQLQGLTLPVKGDEKKSRSFQEKSVRNILQGIEASKRAPFARVLFGLGIRHVGESTAQKLAHHFGTLSTLQTASKEALTELRDIGTAAATAIETYFRDEDNLALLEKLRAADLQLSTNEKSGPRPLQGKCFVISGSFEYYSRDNFRTHIQDLGGQLLTLPSKKTDYLIAGKNTGPTKVEKAEILGIPILSESDFKKLVEELQTRQLSHTENPHTKEQPK